jgi:hypothetical protein
LDKPHFFSSSCWSKYIAEPTYCIGDDVGSSTVKSSYFWANSSKLIYYPPKIAYCEKSNSAIHVFYSILLKKTLGLLWCPPINSRQELFIHFHCLRTFSQHLDVGITHCVTLLQKINKNLIIFLPELAGLVNLKSKSELQKVLKT